MQPILNLSHAQPQDGCLGSVSQFKPHYNIGNVVVDGSLTQAKRFGHFFICVAFCE